MASETTLTSHQRSYNDLKSLVESGHGIAVHEYRRDDGTLMRRYVVAYNADGDPVRRSDLKRALDSGDNGLNAPKIKQINTLAQTIIDSHRKANDSTPEQQRQAAFYTRGGIHYVKSDTVEREDTHEHKKQTLKTPERTTYDHAFGGVVGGVTGEQREVLDFGPTLVGKAPDADISAELNALKDKNFVQIFRSIRAKPENSSKTPAEIYTKALQKYTSDTIKAFQVSLHPDTALDVAKSLQKAAHKIAVPATAVDALSETWLDDHAADFGTRTTAEAVFQAIQDVGAKEVGADPIKDTQTTADHAYQALLSKVNQYWLETNRDTSIHDASFVDLPVGGSPVGGSTPPRGVPPRPENSGSGAPHGPVLKDAREVLQPCVDRKLQELDRKIDLTDQFHEEIMGVSTGIIIRNPNYNEQIEAIIKEVVAEFPDIYDHPDFSSYRRRDIPASEEQNVCAFLALKADEIREEKKLTKDFYRDPTLFLARLNSLESQLASEVLPEKPYWFNPKYRVGLGEYNSVASKRKVLESQIAAMQKVLGGWNTDKGRVELLTVYLHLGVGSAPQPEDFTSLSRKVFIESFYSAELTPGEIGALQTWKLPENIDISEDDQVLSHLMTHLSNHLIAQDLDVKRAKIAAVVTDSGQYPGWFSNNQSLIHFKSAHEFLTKLDIPQTDLDKLENQEVLFALRVAHDALEESVKTGSPETWRTAMLKSLKAKEFEAIHPELDGVAKNPHRLNTTLDAINGATHIFTATHYKNIHDYLVGRKLGAELIAEEIHALLNLLPTAGPIEGHQKLEFLTKKAFEHYTYLRMEAETLGQNLHGWTPTEKHLRDAMAWLIDPTQVTPNDDVKKALLLAKPDNASGVGQVEANLDQAIRIVKLEASAVDPSGYDYTTEDVQAVSAYLEGSGPEPIGNQIKAFKKMQTDEALPTVEHRPAHYQRKVSEAMATATTSKYSGRAVDLKNVWDHTVAQLTGLTAETLAPVPDPRDTYLSAITKLTTTPLVDLSPEEKSVVFKHHDWIQREKGADPEVFKGFFLLILLEKKTPSA